MSDTLEGLRRKMNGAGQLKSVVHSMKVLAASGITQYEKSVLSLTDYVRSVELGLATCFRQGARLTQMPIIKKEAIGAVVFGSDQGLIGQFNDNIVEYFEQELGAAGKPLRVWAVGERAQSRLTETGQAVSGLFAVPNSIAAVTPLVAQILIACETAYEQGHISELYVIHHRPKGGASYEPTSQLLLPLDEVWQAQLARLPWPVGNLPEILGDYPVVLPSLVREYLFVSLFRACAQSLASENASRLLAMQRAEKNIDDLLENLNRGFHQLRQSHIDEELFDVLASFEALSGASTSRTELGPKGKPR